MTTQKTLEATPCGESAMVVGVQGGRKVRNRLEAMGVYPGARIEVLNNGKGPMIISLGEGRVMLERGVANKVLVA